MKTVKYHMGVELSDDRSTRWDYHICCWRWEDLSEAWSQNNFAGHIQLNEGKTVKVNIPFMWEQKDIKKVPNTCSKEIQKGSTRN